MKAPLKIRPYEMIGGFAVAALVLLMYPYHKKPTELAAETPTRPTPAATPEPSGAIFPVATGDDLATSESLLTCEVTASTTWAQQVPIAYIATKRQHVHLYENEGSTATITAAPGWIITEDIGGLRVTIRPDAGELSGDLIDD